MLPYDKIRVIIAVGNPAEALSDLHFYADELDMECWVPLYADFITGQKIYSINDMLAYFRNRCINNLMVPSIISNTCNAGFVYHYCGLEFKSPTINTVIHPADYVKFCANLKHYLEIELEEVFYSLFNGRRVPVGRLDDIEIWFVHDETAEQSVFDWNRRRKRVNYDNLLIMMEDSIEPIQGAVYMNIKKLPYRNLLLSKYISGEGISHYEGNRDFHNRSYSIENWIDLVELLNVNRD